MTNLESQLEGSVALAKRIKQLERLNATLAAEVDLARPVIEACRFAKGTGMIRIDSGHSLGKIYDAITAYEAAKEQG
jgi:hypothetical protein